MMAEPARVKGRKVATLKDGIVLVASDMHYWPGEPSVAHKAFVKFCKKLKPNIVVMNGDVLDACSISRHPPIGWNKLPSVKDELQVCQERLDEVARNVTKNTQLFWPLGNHDARFETRLAQVAPEFKDVHGISLADHFPAWTGCWSLHINENTVVKHRYKGGVHAPHGNTVSAGRSIITGHLHSQKVTPFTDYNGTRYGVDTGCLADPRHDAFADYTEDNPKDWRSGFCVLTFHNGCLLYPELVSVFDANHVQFRGALHEV
jgi:metallophosphoesterase superfamily enzyme